MSKHLISYDLIGGEDADSYEDVIKYIKSFPSYAKALYSQWIVKSSKTAKDIRDELNNIIDDDDVVLVVDITNSASAWHSLPEKAADILRS